MVKTKFSRTTPASVGGGLYKQDNEYVIFKKGNYYSIEWNYDQLYDKNSKLNFGFVKDYTKNLFRHSPNTEDNYCLTYNESKIDYNVNGGYVDSMDTSAFNSKFYLGFEEDSLKNFTVNDLTVKELIYLNLCNTSNYLNDLKADQITGKEQLQITYDDNNNCYSLVGNKGSHAGIKSLKIPLLNEDFYMSYDVALIDKTANSSAGFVINMNEDIKYYGFRLLGDMNIQSLTYENNQMTIKNDGGVPSLSAGEFLNLRLEVKVNGDKRYSDIKFIAHSYEHDWTETRTMSMVPVFMYVIPEIYKNTDNKSVKSYIANVECGYL